MLRELRSLLPYLSRHRITFLAGLALVVVSNRFATLLPRRIEAGIDAIGRGGPLAEVRSAALMLVALAILGGIARFGMRELLNGGSRLVEYDLRNDLFAHIQRMSASFFDRYPTGDLMSRSTNDLLSIRMVAGPSLMYIVDTAVRTTLVLPAMLDISPALTGIALLPLIGLPVGMITLGQRIHHRSLAIQEHFATITRMVHEHLSGVRVVRAYRQEGAEAALFESLNREYAGRNLALARLQGAFHPVLALLGGLGGMAVIGVGGREVIAGHISVGAFVAFNVYLGMLVWPMIALGWAVNLLQRGAAAMQRINVLMAERPAISVAAVPATLPATSGARTVAFEGAWFRYPAAPERGWVLQDISFQVRAGGSIGIVGATGAGKSTLVELLGRSYDPDRGRILLDGLDVRDLALADLRAAVAVVPQETFLFSETLRENVLLGTPGDARLDAAAATAQLAEALPDLPAGWETLLGERGINLSGGQKQRAAIARALVKDPPVFVLDDCLSAVDAHTEARILGALRTALRDRTVLIVSHRVAAVRDTDEIIVLDAGTIVERGTHEALIGAGGRYAQMARRQAMEEELLEATPAGAG